MLCGAHDRGLPAGHVSVTSGYVASRRPEIMAMTLATSGLNAVFSKMPTAMSRMAGIGMSFLDRAPIKSIFADIAQGGKLCKASLLDGKLPR
jgi:2-polyprenyl-6-methoxyphenol hydroxylase-like FAD-dependent oxidoreductase